MKIRNLIEKLTLVNTQGALEIASEFLTEFMNVKTTPLGSLVAKRDGVGENIMIEAHVDQIGFVVTKTDESGFVKVDSYGGIDTRVMPASEITVFGEKQVQGIVTSTPPHLQSDDSAKVPKVSELTIDVGDNVRYISVGDFAVMSPRFSELKNNTVTATSLDNRAGVAVVLLCAEALKETDKAFSVSLATFEEVNGNGALTAAFSENPTSAIAVDVSFAKAPSVPDEKSSKLGGGPMIGISPVLDYEISQKLCKIAEDLRINFSKEVMGSSTGTDADHISTVLSGIRTGLVSIPLRNMHTGVEVASLDDIKACADLITEFVLSGGIANA